MRLNPRTYDFNKQIVFSEIGGLLIGPLFAHVGSLAHLSADLISILSVAGSLIGVSTVWLLTRAIDESRRKTFSKKRMGKDIMNFTPAAFLIALIFVYPTIFFITRAMLNVGSLAYLASFIGILFGTIVFLVAMNIYRHFLYKTNGHSL